jgi:glucose/arabinose dehydrogenase
MNASRFRRDRWLAAAGLLAIAGLVVFSVTRTPTSHEAPERFVGPTPAILPPDEGIVPIVNFSTAAGWPAGKTPSAPEGFTVTRYAEGLDHPRWLYVLPDGDTLVAESSTLPREPKSIYDRIANDLQRKSGAVKPPANRITLLRRTAGQSAAASQTTFLTGLHQPFGMLVLGSTLYVGDTDALLAFDDPPGSTRIEAAPRTVATLPAGGYNNHWTRNVVANRAGTKLYVSVGSGSDHSENGIGNEAQRADILELDPDGSHLRVFASGIRNPVGMAWAPGADVLWTVANERDMLGNDLVPDYLTSVRDGAFYGWPYAYWGAHPDPRVTPARPDEVARAIAPDYALGSHVAALGLAFYTADHFPARYRGGAFVAEHGSWNRKPFAGYKVVYVPFRDGHPSGPPEDFLTGFMPADEPGKSYGRPVGVVVDPDGALLVADDVGDCVWRVAASK